MTIGANSEEPPEPTSAGGCESAAAEAPRARWRPPWTRFIDIGADARALGVTRQHLWSVLAGRVVSKRLAGRYAELKARQKVAKNAPSPARKPPGGGPGNDDPTTAPNSGATYPETKL